MKVALTRELKSFVDRKVAAGEYVSESEVIREALRMLAGVDREREARRADLRAEIAIGLAELEQGKGRNISLAQMKRLVHARIRQNRHRRPA